MAGALWQVNLGRSGGKLLTKEELEDAVARHEIGRETLVRPPGMKAWITAGAALGRADEAPPKSDEKASNPKKEARSPLIGKPLAVLAGLAFIGGIVLTQRDMPRRAPTVTTTAAAPTAPSPAPLLLTSTTATARAPAVSASTTTASTSASVLPRLPPPPPVVSGTPTPVVTSPAKTPTTQVTPPPQTPEAIVVVVVPPKPQATPTAKPAQVASAKTTANKATTKKLSLPPAKHAPAQKTLAVKGHTGRAHHAAPTKPPAAKKATKKHSR